jgi:hypothetical protein
MGPKRRGREQDTFRLLIAKGQRKLVRVNNPKKEETDRSIDSEMR